MAGRSSCKLTVEAVYLTASPCGLGACPRSVGQSSQVGRRGLIT